MSTATLPRTIVTRILAHAQESGETEVCGLVASLHGKAHTVYPIPNDAGDTHHRFSMEPHAQIEAMRKMRQAGEELFAIYHSHPHTPAQPSVTDTAQAAYPEALYLIVSLTTEGVLELSGFRWRKNGFEQVALALE